MKHFRHQDRLSGEDEYYLTTLESIVEFINGVTPKDLKISEQDYKQMYKKACEELDNESKIKEEAAQQELADLLEINGGKESINDTASTVSHVKDS